MPATKKSRNSSGPASKASQKTLTFSNKVTKSVPTSSKDKTHTLNPKIASLPLSKDLGHVSSSAAIAEQAQIEVASLKERTEEEEKALRVSDAQIKKYWKEREKERKAPRVHQEDLSTEERVLRLFDMSSQFGVCLSLSTPSMSIFLSIHIFGSTFGRAFGWMLTAMGDLAMYRYRTHETLGSG